VLKDCGDDGFIRKLSQAIEENQCGGGTNMAKQITVSDTLYVTLNEVARRKRKTVDAVVEQFLNTAISEESACMTQRTELAKAKVRLRKTWKATMEGSKTAQIDDEEVEFLSDLARTGENGQQRALQAYEEWTETKQEN
jgi:hypothetical protein